MWLPGHSHLAPILPSTNAQDAPQRTPGRQATTARLERGARPASGSSVDISPIFRAKGPNHLTSKSGEEPSSPEQLKTLRAVQGLAALSPVIAPNSG